MNNLPALYKLLKSSLHVLKYFSIELKIMKVMLLQ